MLINKRLKTTTSSLLVDGNVITKPEKIADSMNKYFCNIGEELSKDIPCKLNSLLSNQIHAPDGSFIFTPSNAEHTTKAISKFRSSHGFRLDSISSFLLKKGMPILANSLSQMFNLCLSLGKFPDIWKMARVTPIYKDGSRNEISNYRPISVLPVGSRLFEKLVYDQFYTYLNLNSLTDSGQSRFRSFDSALTCLLKCTNDWYLNMDKGQYTSVSFIDLKKAFDSVDHQILLNKLKVYGLSGKEITWFESYLGNHKQCCRVYGQTSNLQPIKLGVPKGFCFGPLLSLTYINDIPSVLHTPLLRTSSGQKALPTGEYAFGTISHVKQKQVDRSPPLKQN